MRGSGLNANRRSQPATSLCKGGRFNIGLNTTQPSMSKDLILFGHVLGRPANWLLS